MQFTEIEEQIMNIGSWTGNKVKYHLKSQSNKIKRKQLNFGEVWECDLGYNVGEEKNKKRPVLIISNNTVNQKGKVVILCITDAKGKVKSNGFPLAPWWYLLYSNTHEQDKMYTPSRSIPDNQKQYYFLSKDSVVQCEDIRSVSKARFNYAKGFLGRIHDDDLKWITQKLSKTFNIKIN